MVQFEDSSIIAQLGLPDMRLPIQYALAYPQRLKSSFERLDFFKLQAMTFEKPDTCRFRNLAFAFEAARIKGNMACTMNAANEIAVAAFLQDKVGFLEMSDIIEKTMQKTSFINAPAYEDYVQTDTEARHIAREFIRK
jgi:1-deoxy-D-xylulose-5-phosphate reductoisomerase